MAGSFATIIGSAAGGVLLVLIVAGLLWYCLHYRKLSNKNSESSSDPSALGKVLSDSSMKSFSWHALS